jgi:uncharacterized protein (DUF983 family)
VGESRKIFGRCAAQRSRARDVVEPPGAYRRSRSGVRRVNHGASIFYRVNEREFDEQTLDVRRAFPLFWRVIRLRCPNCGHGGIFASWLTLVAGVLTVVAILTYPHVPWTAIQYSTIALVLGGAFACYPFAKTTWIAFDLWLRPVTPEEMRWYQEGGSSGRRSCGCPPEANRPVERRVSAASTSRGAAQEGGSSAGRDLPQL